MPGVVSLDADGQAFLPRVPAGQRRIIFFCSTRLGLLLSPRVLRGPIRVSPGDTVTVNLKIPVQACLIPGVSSIGGEFRGHYYGGFEASSFKPCAAAEQPYGSPSQPWAAWVVFDSVARSRSPRWPNVYDTTTVYGNDVYVRLYGTLTGPDVYGHLGISKYELNVLEIREVRAPSAEDCKARHHDGGAACAEVPLRLQASLLSSPPAAMVSRPGSLALAQRVTKRTVQC